VQIDLALRRWSDLGKDLQQGRLAGPVPADNAQHLAAVDLERNILQRPKLVLARPAAERAAQLLRDQFPQGGRPARGARHAKGLSDIPHRNGEVR